MWKVIDGPKTLKLTKTLAEQFKALPHIKRDRPVHQARVNHHLAELKAGRFRSPEWATALCKADGIKYRVNGKHTSEMLAAAPTELIADVKVILTNYECETLEDVAVLWATFDSKASMRTSQDIYGAIAGSCPQLDHVPRKDLCVIAAGLGLASDPNRVSTGNISAEEKAKALVAELDFTIWAAVLLSGSVKESRVLRRSATIAAMHDTWKKHRSDADKFWTLVRTGEGAKPTDPDRRLQRYLMETNVAFGNGIRTSARAASAREIYAKCIHAWNAWRRGESTELKYHINAKVPKAT